MISLFVTAGLALALGLLHLSARYVCRQKGHRFHYEVTNSGTEPIALRCKRCRLWARDT